MSDDTTTKNTEGTAEEAAETPEATPAAHTPPEATPAAHGDDDGHDDDGQVDTFPRSVVEKLRRENAALRDRANQATESVTALQRQHAEHRIKAAGMKPAAVWAVAELADVLDDQGAVDSAKLREAMTAAKDTLGVDTRRRTPRRYDMQSGATSPGQERRNGWAEAFTKPDKLLK